MLPKDGPRKPDRIEEPKKPVFSNVSEASIQALAVAITVLPQLLDMLDEIADSLSLVRLYFERKGIEEGIISADDIDNDEKPETKGPVVDEK